MRKDIYENICYYLTLPDIDLANDGKLANLYLHWTAVNIERRAILDKVSLYNRKATSRALFTKWLLKAQPSDFQPFYSDHEIMEMFMEDEG